MAYFLVLLRRSSPGDVPDGLEQEHVAFIDGLIERRLVVLGGGFGFDVSDLRGAYVLRAGSEEEAAAVAHDDPLARAGAVECRVLRWELVGVDPGAVEPELLVRAPR